ncbi:hypothetical protein D6764_03460 [Candidatus Woesearchaeota archaeon]|nr:MAG: hypothetical protein D6764_03460 [Candidatus Woesearchaeota archaeon]
MLEMKLNRARRKRATGSRQRKLSLPPVPPFYERHPLLVLTLLFVFVLSFGWWFRSAFFNSILPGSEPYYHMKISEIVLAKGFTETEFLTGAPRHFLLTPFYVLASNIIYFLGTYSAARLLPPLFSYLSLVLLWALLSLFRISTRKKFFVCFSFVISPAFISLVFLYLPHSFDLFLLLFSVFAIHSRSSFWRLTGLFSSLLLSASGFSHYASFVLIVLFMLRSRNLLKVPSLSRKKFLHLVLLLSSLSFVARFSLFLPKIPFSESLKTLLSAHPLNFQSVLLRSFTIFGAKPGLSLFAVVLSSIALLQGLKRKKVLAPLYILSAVLLLLFLFGSGFSLVVLSLLMAFASGFVIDFFLSRDWSLMVLREFTAWLLVCGLLFAGAVQFSAIIHSRPGPNDVSALKDLSLLCSQKRAVVLSHQDNGFWIEAISDCPSFTDGNALFFPESEWRLQVSERLFRTKELNTARELLSEFNIGYLLIDEPMKSGKVWSLPDDGLLFLLRNNETFKREVMYPGIEIWSTDLS